MNKHQVFMRGLAWGEGLRWHDDTLYWSDIFGKKVCRASAPGVAEKLADIPVMPSGLGFLPDDSLLIVSGGDCTLQCYANGKTEVYADLSGMGIGFNDMVVSAEGNAYVGAYNFAIERYTGGPAEGWIVLVRPDGSKQIVGTGCGLIAPNGMVITPDGKTLIAADTMGRRLIQYAILPDATLGQGETWADLPYGPDGICLDQDSAIWAVTPNDSAVIRVLRGGEITTRIPFDDTPLCCVLGGEDEKTLFVVTVPARRELATDELSNAEKQREKMGSVIYAVETGKCPKLMLECSGKQ